MLPLFFFFPSSTITTMQAPPPPPIPGRFPILMFCVLLTLYHTNQTLDSIVRLPMYCNPLMANSTNYTTWNDRQLERIT